MKALVAQASSGIVGRDVELGTLLDAVERARLGHATTVLVSGDAGVGKTRLVHELVSHAREAGALALLGECVELGEDGRPYAPFVAIVRRLVREVGTGRVVEWAGATADELAHLLPQLAYTTVSDDDVRPARLHLALTTLVESCARTRPVVLVLEDLHWADRSTRSFLPELVHVMRDLGAVTILTVRADELTAGGALARTLAELVRGEEGLRLHVPPMTREEQARHLAQLEGHPVDDDLVQRVHARTRGNPFFAEELVAAGLDGELPDTVRDLLLHRVVRLPRHSRDLLRLLAVAGDPCPLWLVAAAAGTDGDEVETALRPAVTANVLVADPEGDGYGFRHPLLREATMQTILPGERRRLHRAVAGAIEHAGEDAVSTDLAHHWREAGDAQRALPASVAAARFAVGLGAYPDALAQYDAALRIWRALPDAASLVGAPRHAILSEAAGVAARHGEYARAGALQRQALDDLDVEADPNTASAYFAALGDIHRVMVDGDGSRTAYERALELAPDGDPGARAVALSGLARNRMLTEQHDEACALASSAGVLARTAGLPAVEAHALLTLGAAQAFLGDVEGGLASLRAGQETAVASGDEAVRIRAYVNLSAVLAEAGRVAEVPALVDEAGEVLGALGRRHAQWKCLMGNAVESLLLLGRWGELSDKVAELALPDPGGLENLEACGLLARLDMEQGRLEEAAAGMARARAWVVPTREPQLIGPVWAAAVELACWQHDAWGAVELAATGWEHLDAPQSRYLLDLAAAGLRAAGMAARISRTDEELADARATGERWYARACAATSGPATDSLPVRAWRQRIEAELATLQGRPAAGPWDEAAALWARLEQTPSVAYSRWRQAEALLAEGDDREAATRALCTAHELASRIGAVTLGREVERLARRGRIDVGVHADGGEPPVDLAQLTGREQEVLSLVAEGLTNAEIASRLFVSPRTVSTHVSNILGKVGARTRTEAAAHLYATAPHRGDR